MPSVTPYRKGYEPLMPKVGAPRLDADHCHSCGLRLNEAEKLIGEHLCDWCIVEEAELSKEHVSPA